MKFIFKIVGLSLIFLLAILLIAGLFYPRKYFLEQSIFIQAPKEIVWKNISTFANYQKWNPWSELDPHMRYRVEEVDGIVGSIYHWEGNHRVGSGNIGYLTLKPMERAELGLALIKPLALESKMTFLLTETPKGIQVTWALKCDLSYPYNALLRIVYRPKKLVEEDLKGGLQRLKLLSEKEAGNYRNLNVHR